MSTFMLVEVAWVMGVDTVLVTVMYVVLYNVVVLAKSRIALVAEVAFFMEGVRGQRKW